MKKWCKCNLRCMVKNPRKEVVHGSHQIYDSRHNCRCALCVEAYKQHVSDREFVLISKYLQRSAYEQSNA